MLKNVDWKPVSKRQTNVLDYLHIISPKNMKMENGEDIGRGKFWNTLPFKENANLIIGKDEL